MTGPERQDSRDEDERVDGGAAGGRANDERRETPGREMREDPYRNVRRRARDRARRGDDPFLDWLRENDEGDDRAWWEQADEPALLPDAPNWRPASIVGRAVPATERDSGSVPPGAGFDRDRAWPPVGRGRDPFALVGLRDDPALPRFDEEALERELRALADDWEDGDPNRRRKGGRKKRRRTE